VFGFQSRSEKAHRRTAAPWYHRAEYAIVALGGAASRLAQIEPLREPTRGNLEGVLSHPSAIDLGAATFGAGIITDASRSSCSMGSGAQTAEVPANGRLVRRDTEVTT